MSIGIRKFFGPAANVVVTNSVALVSSGCISPIAAGEEQRIRFFVPFTVGATGGIRAQLVVPAAGAAFVASILLVNTVAPSITSAIQTASAAFTNALANAGSHWLQIDAYIRNGANAGNVDLQIAQNSADALSLTILRGGYCEVIAGS